MIIKEIPKKRKDGSIVNVKFFEFSESEFTEANEDYCGICLACGEIADSCEPDARAYECESCGENKVYGLEESVIMGRITFNDK